MAQDIEVQRQQLMASLRKAGLQDESILTAVASTPREFFVDEAQRSMAYADRALPIGYGPDHLTAPDGCFNDASHCNSVDRSGYWK